MAFRNGIRGVFTGVGGPCLIEEGRLTWPGFLRQHGYATALMGKWHVGMTFYDGEGQAILKNGLEAVQRVDYSRPVPDGPIHRGFDRFFGTVCCPTTDWLYAYMEGDRIPVPPTGIIDRGPLPKHPYSRDNRPGMIAPGFDVEEVDMVFLEKSLEFLEERSDSEKQPFFLFHSAQAVHLPSFPGDAFKGKTEAGPHGDFIFEFDHIVGELLGALDRLGLAKNTLVIVSSDNGPEVTSVVHMRKDHDHDGARPWRGMKRDQWEGGHRVPFIARWPGVIEAGRVESQTICLTDLMATTAAIIGEPLPNDAAEDSVNLWPVLQGRGGNEHPVRPYTLHQTISLDLAIRRGPWKYLDHPGSGGNNYERPHLRQFARADAEEAPGQLYHLGDDPGETRNLYHEKPGLVEELRALLLEAIASGRSTARRSP